MRPSEHLLGAVSHGPEAASKPLIHKQQLFRGGKTMNIVKKEICFLFGLSFHCNAARKKKEEMNKKNNKNKKNTTARISIHDIILSCTRTIFQNQQHKTSGLHSKFINNIHRPHKYSTGAC